MTLYVLVYIVKEILGHIEFYVEAPSSYIYKHITLIIIIILFIEVLIIEKYMN